MSHGSTKIALSIAAALTATLSAHPSVAATTTVAKAGVPVTKADIARYPMRKVDVQAGVRLANQHKCLRDAQFQGSPDYLLVAKKMGKLYKVQLIPFISPTPPSPTGPEQAIVLPPSTVKKLWKNTIGWC